MLPLLKKAKKLPRLALMGFIPLLISVQIPLPYHIAFALQSWGLFFLCFFWIEGLTLSMKAIRSIEENAKLYMIMMPLYDMESDQHGKA